MLTRLEDVAFFPKSQSSNLSSSEKCTSSFFALSWQTKLRYKHAQIVSDQIWSNTLVSYSITILLVLLTSTSSSTSISRLPWICSKSYHSASRQDITWYITFEAAWHRSLTWYIVLKRPAVQSHRDISWKYTAWRSCQAETCLVTSCQCIVSMLS